MAQSAKRPTLAQAMISRFMGSSPMSGSVLTAQLRAWTLLQILCLPLSLPSPTHALSLSVSKIKINIKKIKYLRTDLTKEVEDVYTEHCFGIFKFILLILRERKNMGGAEREGDTESEAGSGL